jgi:Holliday junction DNA helicase RuvA
MDEFKRAVVNGNLTVLHAIPGVGKKIAERLVVELREKIAVEGNEKKKKGSESIEFLKNGQIAEDCLQALINLGYRRNEVQEALKHVFLKSENQKLKVEDVIREALKVI